MKRLTLFVTTFALFGFIAACNRQQTSQPVPAAASPNGTQYLLAEQPQDAKDVIAVRENAPDEEPVVVVGRIGGSQNPWVEGMAAFSIVDLSLKACSDIEGDKCKKPWDYCCQIDLLPKAPVLVKVVDDSGNIVSTDSRELLAVKELDTVVVNGTAKRDDAGNLTVLASKIYVKP